MAKRFKPSFLTFQWLITVLVTIAAINWGLVEFLDFNLVEWISFGVSWIATTIYALVALSGIALIPSVIYMTVKK